MSMSSTEGLPMRRTPSSLLSFKLREFLDSKEEPTQELPLPLIAERSKAPRQHHRQQGKSALLQAHPTNAVYVDCFFYGFWLPMEKLPAYQASLSHLPGMAAVGS